MPSENQTRNNNGDILIARLAESIDSTAKLTQALLTDLRESETDFASIKTELNNLKENVKSLSLLIQGSGAGADSLLIRVALIEQNIDNIKKWVDSHNTSDQELKNQLNALKQEIKQLETRLANIETSVQQFVQEKQTQEKEKRASISREIEIASEKQKSDIQIKTERKSATIKIIAAVIIAIIGGLSGFFVSKCNPTPINKNIPTFNIKP